MSSASRRGVELSLNTILLIALGLIVVAIIIYLVAKNTGGVSESLRSCAAKGGRCVAVQQGTPPCGPGERGSAFMTEDCKSGPSDTRQYVCCIPSDL